MTIHKPALALGALALSCLALAAPAPADACPQNSLWISNYCRVTMAAADQVHSPITIARCQMNSADGEVTFRVNYFNRSDRTVNAVRFKFTGLDDFGYPLASGAITGDVGDNVAPGITIKDRAFVSPYIWADPDKIVCSVGRVRFEDGTTWTAIEADAINIDVSPSPNIESRWSKEDSAKATVGTAPAENIALASGPIRVHVNSVPDANRLLAIMRSLDLTDDQKNQVRNIMADMINQEKKEIWDENRQRLASTMYLNALVVWPRRNVVAPIVLFVN